MKVIWGLFQFNFLLKKQMSIVTSGQVTIRRVVDRSRHIAQCKGEVDCNLSM